MLDIDVNAMIWGIVMSLTMKGAVHLGQDSKRICVQTRTQNSSNSNILFDVSQNLILNQKSEIYGISVIEWKTNPWSRTTLLRDRANKLSKANLHVYSYSVLGFG